MTAWIEANTLQIKLHPFGGKKKECIQHVADKIITMQVDFSAAKTSTEKYEIMQNWVMLCRRPI